MQLESLRAPLDIKQVLANAASNTSKLEESCFMNHMAPFKAKK